MARRKDHTHDQISQMAVLATIELLNEKGMSGLSLRKIASAIGYVPSTLINIFGSYNYLLLAVSKETLSELYQRLQASVTAIKPQDNIIKMACEYSQFAHDNRQRFKLVFELQLLESESLPESQTNLIAQLFALMEKQLSKLFPNASSSQLMTMNRLLWGGVHGLTLLSLDQKLFIEGVKLQKLIIEHVQCHLQSYQQNAITHSNKESSCY